MRKAMQRIVVALCGGRAPEDPRPKGVGPFRRRTAPELRAQTYGYAREIPVHFCIRNGPIQMKDTYATVY